jgi:two-component SAPR family response regulator
MSFTKQMMRFAGYKIKKVYVKTLGGLFIFPYNNRQESLKMRTKKERELFAFLLDAGSEGVTKEQIYNAIWSESESNDVKKLIGVNLAQIKKDLVSLDIMEPIINHEKHYSICMDEIVSDTALFEAAINEFSLQNSNETAQKVLSLYMGDYLSDFEALWAVSNRIKYREAYEKALDFTKGVFDKDT